ncbi:helix-hairpin-helix domain-containing protein [bacterium]|nr:helix-hairpin-helix domain-containing protein [bacterium]
MKKIIIVVCAIILAANGWTAFEFEGNMPLNLATGGANLVLMGPEAIYNNPAMLAYLENVHLNFTTSRLYGMDELANTSANYIKRFGSMTMGLNLIKFGSWLYAEQQIQFAGAFNVGSNFALGFKGKYMSVVIDEIGSASTLALDMGMVLFVNQELYFGARFRNVSAPYIGQEYMARDVGIGVSYTPFVQLNIYFNLIANIPASFLKHTYGLGSYTDAEEAEIEEAVGDFADYDAYLENFAAKRDLYSEYHFGIKYDMTDNFALFGGIEYLHSERLSYSAGLGIYGGGMAVSYALKVHPELGATHTFAFGLGNKESKPELSVINGRININLANAEELSAIPGIGSKTAERIVEYRKVNGPFRRVEDLQNVSRIGAKTVEKIRSYITVGSKYESSSQIVPSRSSSSTSTASKTSYSGPLIDINSADSAELQKLPRVGVKTAANILSYRKQNGGFKNIEDIMNVPRIGPKTFENMRNMIKTGEYDPAVDNGQGGE